MEKVIATTNLTPKFRWWSFHNPVSYIKKAVNSHPQWEIVDEKIILHYQLKKTTFLVIKNKTGVLDYDPYLMIMISNNDIYIAPATNYDSSKEWYNQEGTINNGGNYTALGIKKKPYNDYGSGHLIPKITSLVLNDYSLVFSVGSNEYYEGNAYYYYFFFDYLKFEIFDATDTKTSGMMVSNNSGDFYIYYNNKWFGKDFNNVYSRQGSLDIDKPAGNYHKPNPQGSFNATKRTFFINTKTDTQDTPLWKYIGQSYLFYANSDIDYQYLHYGNGDNYYAYIYDYLAEGILVRVKEGDNEKDYFISSLDYQVNDSSVVETPNIVEEYNRLQSDFFANPFYYPYYWKLQDSINEVDERLPSSEDDNWYYLKKYDLYDDIYAWTVHLDVKREDNSSNAQILALDGAGDDSNLLLITDSNDGKQYIVLQRQWNGDTYYFTLSNKFTFNVGDEKLLTVSVSKEKVIVFFDKNNVSSGNSVDSNLVDINEFYLRKAFGDFSDVRFFRKALTEDEMTRLQNGNSISSSLYTI